ncbi:MAG: hypothetical protein U5K74_12750 [Gemmatimonadaceae bacterium]|nr:hypothetical protein [Gemmatimonadaceae bacterium]
MRTKALATIEAKFWMPALGQYAFALLEDGSVNPNVTAWAATAMAFAVLDPVRGAEMATKLASSSIMTDWGARPLSAASTQFDPLHYNNGAVWPFVTGFTALAQYTYHNANAGKFALDAIARTGFDFSLGRNPEVLSGRLYKPLDTAVPHQFFATSMVLTPLIRGLFGIDVDAPRRKVTIAPHLPPDWDTVSVFGVPVGADRLSFTLTRDDSSYVIAPVLGSGLPHRLGAPGSSSPTPIELEFSPALPLGATASRPEADIHGTPGDVHATVRARISGGSDTLRITYRGGWSIMPAEVFGPIPGARSGKARVVNERMVEGSYTVTLEGLAGHAAGFLFTPPDGDEAAQPQFRTTAGASVQMNRPTAGSRTRFLTVTFPSTGANADGFSTTTVTFPRSAP